MMARGMGIPNQNGGYDPYFAQVQMSVLGTQGGYTGFQSF